VHPLDHRVDGHHAHGARPYDGGVVADPAHQP
jgi:hypothetical protein